jgi:predicted ATPase
MSANLEAASHLGRGLALIPSLPDGPARIKLELGLQMSLGSVLLATEGYGSPNVAAAYDRARELCRALGDPPELFQVLFGQTLFRLVQGDMARTQRDAGEILTRVQQSGDSGYIVGFHTMLGVASTYRAQYDRAREHLEEAVTLYDPVRDANLAQQQGQDPAAVSFGYLARALWCQGYPVQATRALTTGLEIGERVNHAHTLTMMGMLAATLHGMQRQWPESQAHAEAALQLAREGHFPLWQANAMTLRGAALAHQGRVEEGIAAIEQGLAIWDVTGVRLAKPHGQARLAEAYLMIGRREEGLHAIDESLRWPEEAWWLPEQVRLRAELLRLVPGNETEAEATLLKALELARSQGARALELRVAMSLARLWQAQGRGEEGWALVAGCCACLPEALDTPDVQEALALLEQLAPAAGFVAWPVQACPEAIPSAPLPVLRLP